MSSGRTARQMLFTSRRCLGERQQLSETVTTESLCILAYCLMTLAVVPKAPRSPTVVVANTTSMRRLRMPHPWHNGCFSCPLEKSRHQAASRSTGNPCQLNTRLTKLCYHFLRKLRSTRMNDIQPPSDISLNLAAGCTITVQDETIGLRLFPRSQGRVRAAT